MKEHWYKGETADICLQPVKRQGLSTGLVINKRHLRFDQYTLFRFRKSLYIYIYI